MRFEDSWTGRNSAFSPAKRIFEDWFVVWEYVDDSLIQENAMFLGKNGERYCIGCYKFPKTTDFFSANSYSKEEKKKYLDNSLFFDSMRELVEYGKTLKIYYDRDGEGHKYREQRKQLLLAIKRECEEVFNFMNTVRTRSRLDTVE